METAAINIKLSLQKFLSFFILIFAANAVNAETLPEINTSYKVYVGGMHVADLKATSSGTAFNTQFNLAGMASVFSNYSNTSTTEFRSEGGNLVPVKFSKESIKKNQKKTTEIGYNHQGALEKITSNDENAQLNTIKGASELGAIDPLAMVVRARKEIRAALSGGKTQFSMPLYDGKKVAQLNFDVVGTVKKEIVGIMRDVVHVKIERSFADQPRNAKTSSTIELFMSNDKALIPVFARAKAPVATATIILDSSCYPAECV